MSSVSLHRISKAFDNKRSMWLCFFSTIFFIRHLLGDLKDGSKVEKEGDEEDEDEEEEVQEEEENSDDDYNQVSASELVVVEVSLGDLWLQKYA